MRFNIDTIVIGPHATPFYVAIIGDGLTGLTLSINLTHRTVSHKLYESAKCFSKIGAGIAMGPNAVWALALIDPRLRECYARCTTYNDREDQRELCFDYIYRIECDKNSGDKNGGDKNSGDKNGGDKNGGDKNKNGGDKNGGDKNSGAKYGDVIHSVSCCNYDKSETGRSCVHRAKFLDEMIQLVPDGVAQFNKRMTDMHQDAEGVHILFDDGTTADASAVVACDGIKSLARKIVLGVTTRTSLLSLRENTRTGICSHELKRMAFSAVTGPGVAACTVGKAATW